MKITVLNENTAHGSFRCEHGLSLYIETGEHRILFDAGQTGIFAENAKKMHIDLAQVDICVLSHGHYDHGGGLTEFLNLNHTAPVYASQYAFEPYYNAKGKYIGLDTALLQNKQVVLTDKTTVLSDNIRIISCNDRENVYAFTTFGLSKKIGDKVVEDNFLHEQYLWIEENGKTYLFSGCSHKGILNIMHHFHTDYFIGGFHLSKIDAQQDLLHIAADLDSYPTGYFTCHCTGEKQFCTLKKKMHHLEYLSTGDELEI